MSQHPHGDVVDPSLVRLDELLQRIAIPTDRTAHERSVVPIHVSHDRLLTC